MMPKPMKPMKPMKPIIASLLIFFIFIAGSYAEQEKNTFTIAIDIGHTPKKYGATSARGTGEYLFNKSIALKLHENLIDKGFTRTFIINPQGEEISLKSRTQTAKQKKTDLFISIHHDSVNEKYLKKWTHRGKNRFYSDNFKGYSLFISDKNKQNRIFANILGETLLADDFRPTLHHAEKIKGENRRLLDAKKGIYEFGQLVVLKTATFPALLFECGVILNREEEALLSSANYQDKLASALATAIVSYYLYLEK
jgi:N-acetylmuramoyl-L-alanine amidase